MRPRDRLHERLHERLREQVERQARRMRQAEKDRDTLLAQTVYLGTLGLLLILPVVVGAYVGSWLDDLSGDYSVHWTVVLLLAGLAVGMLNVYLYVRK